MVAGKTVCAWNLIYVKSYQALADR